MIYAVCILQLIIIFSFAVSITANRIRYLAIIIYRIFSIGENLWICIMHNLFNAANANAVVGQILNLVPPPPYPQYIQQAPVGIPVQALPIHPSIMIYIYINQIINDVPISAIDYVLGFVSSVLLFYTLV